MADSGPHRNSGTDKTDRSMALRHDIVAQWIILVASLLVLGGITGFHVLQQYENLDSQERDRLSNLARVIDDNMGGQLHTTNLVLQEIREGLPEKNTPAELKDLNSWLSRLCDVMPGVRTLLVTDDKGTIIASNRQPLLNRNFKDRDYFSVPRRQQDPSVLYISPPFTTVLGVFAIGVTRVVQGPRGEFAGVVSATLDPDYFRILLGSVLYASDMWSSLAHDNGLQILMVPEREGQAGKDLARPGSFFTRHKDSGRSASMMSGTVYATGEERLIAVRTINTAEVKADKPLVVAVSRDPEMIYSGWRRAVRVQAILFGVLALASVFGLSMFQRWQRDSDRREVEAAAALKASLREKETLLKEIHHRVKNNMQVISSLLALQGQKAENEEIRGMFEESRQRVKSMALVHEKLYHAKDLSRIDFRDYITTVVNELQVLYQDAGRKVSTSIEVGEFELGIDTAIPCGLIINELVTNAFKYAFPGERQGELIISFTISDNICTLTVRDNGIGSAGDFDFSQSRTLGLRLVDVLAKQLGGDFRISQDQGTLAVVTFTQGERRHGKK